MYVYTCTRNTAKVQTFGQPTLPVIRYIEYSSLSRDPINQKMKVGQIINILPSQSKLYNMKMFNNKKKKNPQSDKWEPRNLEKHLVTGYFGGIFVSI